MQKNFRPYLKKSFFPQGKNHEHTENSPQHHEGNGVIDMLRHKTAPLCTFHKGSNAQHHDEQDVEDEGKVSHSKFIKMGVYSVISEGFPAAFHPLNPVESSIT